MKINDKNLEKALKKKDSGEKNQRKIPKETEIGFHQGALNTLINERNELFRIIQNIEAIMKTHIKRLEELGVKIQKKSS